MVAGHQDGTAKTSGLRCAKSACNSLVWRMESSLMEKGKGSSYENQERIVKSLIDVVELPHYARQE